MPAGRLYITGSICMNMETTDPTNYYGGKGKQINSLYLHSKYLNVWNLTSWGEVKSLLLVFHVFQPLKIPNDASFSRRY